MLYRESIVIKVTTHILYGRYTEVIHLRAVVITEAFSSGYSNRGQGHYPPQLRVVRFTSTSDNVCLISCKIAKLDGTVKFQDDLSQKEYYDMIDVDEEYDAAVSGFIRGAVAKAQPFFFYFCSQ